MNNPMPKDNEVDEKVPVYVATAPERIFLQVADDAYYAENPFPTVAEITWCDHSVMALEVAYRREDLHAATVAELRAEVERLRDTLTAIRQYGSDTLSGRADGGSDDREWQRDAVREMTKRARVGLGIKLPGEE